MERLYDRLYAYGKSDYYGFHMPGHKRNGSLMDHILPYELDITEIEGFDDLHHADGILKEAQERCARVFGAGETHFLINGSTVGILSSILGCTRKGDKILVSRHCHKSVYHAMRLGELVPRYLYAKSACGGQISGEITAEQVENAFDIDPDIRAVVIVSPTYDGVVSDVAGIARVAHTHGVPLIVDEAHGAHFGFDPYFPNRANALGADAVIQSFHKELPSLTQTAVLHLNGDLLHRRRVKAMLDMLQSSSPSYILMASLDACADLMEKRGEELAAAFAKRLKAFRESLADLAHLELLETEHFDPSKIVVGVGDGRITAKELYERLLGDYHLQMELVGGTYVLALTSLADTDEGLARLGDAIHAIDREIGGGAKRTFTIYEGAPEQVLTPYQAAVYLEDGEDECLAFAKSEGRIALEYAYLYPPGSPLVVPGERITGEALARIAYYEKNGLRIEGTGEEGRIRVLRGEHG